MTHRVACTAALIAGTAVFGRAHADPPAYTVQFLGPTLMVTDLNDQGWAIGWTIEGAVRSWVWSPDAGYQMLQTLPGASDTTAHDVNNAGTIVGTSNNQPVFWTHVDGVYGSPTVLPILPDHSGGDATAINDAGDIVGISTQGMFQRATLFTAAGGPVDLVPFGFWPVPAAINEARQVCGHDLVIDLNTEAVVNLGVPAGPPSFIFTIASDINDAGAVCGQGTIGTSQPDNRIPVRWSPNEGWDQLLSQPTPYASATSINELGDCGIAYLKVVRMEGEGVLAPGDLLAATETGWDFGGTYGIEYAVIVNDQRQLLTAASNSETGEAGAVLLTPTNLSGDVDGDGVTGFADVLRVIGSWGAADPAADCTMDGVVGFADILAVIAGWD